MRYENSPVTLWCDESFGDRRVVSATEGPEGSVTIAEEMSGPSASLAYGEERHVVSVTFPAESVAGLAAIFDCEEVVGEGDAWARGVLAGPEHSLADLMDVCDQRGISYAYASTGPLSGTSYRPTSGQGGEGRPAPR